MLKIGSAAPPFELPDQAGMPVRLADVLTRGPVVLYFYPSDFTPVCTQQACMFRDAHEELTAAGVQVIGISTQGSASHSRFAAMHGLRFPLLADVERRVIQAYKAVGLLGLGTRRVSYFIGGDGVIRDAEVATLRIARHRRFVERVLRAQATADRP